MVEGSDNQTTHTGNEPESIKPAREPRVARTMLDISLLQKKSPRKVAKTLLEQDNPVANLRRMENPEANSQETFAKVDNDALETPPKLRRIARTMLELDIQLAAEEALLSSIADKPEVVKTSQVDSGRYVAKTMLDHSMLFQAVSNSSAKMEQKAAEIAKERANEPPVEPIKPIVAERKASKCDWSWTDPSNAKERYRACSLCQASVYDFEGIEREQAEALVFKRENLKKPKFYERSDGKFMTRDCPRQVARKAQLVMLSALALVSIASVVIVLMLMPSLPKSDSSISPSEKIQADKQTNSNPTTSDPTASGQTVLESSGSPTAARPTGPDSTTSMSVVNTKVAPGNFHYENGKVTSRPVPSNEESAAAQESATPKPTSNGGSDDRDQLWDSH